MTWRPARRATATLIPLILGVGLAGCGSTPPRPSGEPASQDPSSSPGPIAMSTLDGIRVTLSLERAPLPSAQRTRALVVVDNLSPDVRNWQGGGCNFLATVTIHTAVDVLPDPGVDWPGVAGRFKRLASPGSDPSDDAPFVDERFADDPEGLVCPANLSVNHLQPGQRLEWRIVWNGEVASVAAPAGPATVAAEFPYLGPVPAGVDPLEGTKPIIASIDTEVVGAGVVFLSADQIIDAALADERFTAWLRSAAPGKWQGTDFVSHGGTADVILTLLKKGVATDGWATVDRTTGRVLGFETAAH